MTGGRTGSRLKFCLGFAFHVLTVQFQNNGRLFADGQVRVGRPASEPILQVLPGQSQHGQFVAHDALFGLLEAGVDEFVVSIPVQVHRRIGGLGLADQHQIAVLVVRSGFGAIA